MAVPDGLGNPLYFKGFVYPDGAQTRTDIEYASFQEARQKINLEYNK